MESEGFLRNQWYVAAMGTEVRETPFTRVICDEPVVLFRRRDGSVAALEDRCPHRLAPLSSGEVVGDEIQCGYHGVRFDGAGTCTAIPSQKAIPSRGFAARAYPVVEKYALIFIWTGDPALADEALLPDWSVNTAPGWTAVHGYHYVKGHYQLVLDNLLDLTHVNFTHKTTLAGPGVVEAPMTVEVADDVVRTERIIRNVDPAPIHRAIKGLTGKIDRFQFSEFRAPTYIFITLGAQPAGESETMIEPTHLVLNCATPETGRSTHYFWSVVRCFALDDPAVSEKFLEITRFAFDEDVVIIEAQQRMIESAPGRRLLGFQGDRAGVAARRIVSLKHEEEAGMAAVA